MRAYVEGIRDIVSGGPVGDSQIKNLIDLTTESLPDFSAGNLCSIVSEPGRYLCYKDQDHGFVVMLMAWGPGDETPIHDHGTWGVEAILTNELLVTSYSESEIDPQPLTSRILKAGQVMYNIPPDRDVHRVSNPCDTMTISMHLYGKEMSNNRQFIPGKGYVPCALKTNCLEMPREFGLSDLAG